MAIGRKMIPRIIEAINEKYIGQLTLKDRTVRNIPTVLFCFSEGSNDMIQRLLLNLANLVKGCPKNQDMLFELAGQNIYDLALEDRYDHCNCAEGLDFCTVLIGFGIACGHGVLSWSTSVCVCMTVFTVAC